MRQFLHPSTGSFALLKNRARRKCIRFTQQELPPSCHPNRADIAFESVGESARLYVERGITYRGRSEEIREWFSSGARDFTTFDDLARWIQGPIRDEFESAAYQQPSTLSEGSSHSSSSLTDLETVREQVRSAERPVRLDAEHLHESLTRRIRGQDSAMQSLASVVARHSARKNPKRPAVLFAVGPTGVGKTQSAETLAEVLSEDVSNSSGYRYLRLDMTEYQEAHRVSQLIGAPQGYVGHDEGSQLLDTLNENSRTVVLFDEIEKAHPSILRVLMNAMDAGRLSSSSRGSGGHEVDCREAIFLFTSNLDAGPILEELQRKYGFGDRDAEDEVCRRRLNSSGIAPEIVGRIGRFLVFRELTTEIRAEILTLSIAEVAREYGVQVEYVEPEAVVALMKHNAGGRFGMRPDQYLVDEHLGELFARWAENRGPVPCRVSGPPYRCRDLVDAANLEMKQEEVLTS